MQKVVYVAVEPRGESGSSASALLAGVRDAFADEWYRGVSVNLPRRDVEEERDRVRGVVLSQLSAPAPGIACQLVAVLSLWVDCADDMSEAEAFLAGFSDDVSGYAVNESVARWWASSERRPADGVNAVTLMRRNPAMSQREFLAHWAGVHMPISLEYHPQWRYVRNAVAGTLLGDDARAPHAIAEEGFANPRDLVDPMRFYGVPDGSADTLATHKKIVFDDVPIFLDIASTTTFVTEEHVIRSAWTPYAGRGV